MYCKKCGNEISEGAEYCPKCGVPQNVNELMLASTGERILAWIIDGVIIGFVVSALSFPGMFFPFHTPFLNMSLSSVALFLYWTYTEGTTGQSIGKKVMKIKVTDLDGEQIDISTSMYQAFGKAFLLPLDALIGLFAYQEKEQRLFNHLSGTIVVKE
ncbi:RDD family protein [Candidatus Bathyarchaeota archaeon]|nr:RDD family protein [Candidatus Bathyarchaeota archaeon]